ncbi:hypothetical protein HQ520_04875 [bacterium]|nr:hypothetical protein [bacterium]
MPEDNAHQSYEACNENIRRALELARSLIILADEGEAESRDDGCVVLFGVLRDCAYKIRAEAEREKEMHRWHGVWTTSKRSVETS